MATNKKSSPVSSLNALLKTLVVLSVLLIGGGFYFGYNQLKDLSDNINSTSSQTITDTAAVQNLKSQLTSDQPYLDKAAAIAISEGNYTNQFTTDIGIYAAKSGISISEYNTNPSNTAAMTSSIVSGVNSHFITVTIQNPISYTGFVQFLRYIETNLPKMQVTGIEITPLSYNSDKINVDPLTIEVFTQ